MTPYSIICQTKSRNYFLSNDSYGIWTHVTAVKGRCLNRLTKEPSITLLLPYSTHLKFSYHTLSQYRTPRVGLEPTTLRLTAECSTIELSRKIYRKYVIVYIPSKPHTEHYTLHLFFVTLPFFWISLRPISSNQLHALLHFHPCPIYLVFFKGSWDISSWGGLHA